MWSDTHSIHNTYAAYSQHMCMAGHVWTPLHVLMPNIANIAHTRCVYPSSSTHQQHQRRMQNTLFRESVRALICSCLGKVLLNEQKKMYDNDKLIAVAAAAAEELSRVGYHIPGSNKIIDWCSFCTHTSIMDTFPTQADSIIQFLSVCARQSFMLCARARAFTLPKSISNQFTAITKHLHLDRYPKCSIWIYM